MRNALSIALLVSLCAALPSGEAIADAGSCYAVNEPDARAYCLARVRKDPGMCYAVQRSDLRAQCLAEVRGDERKH